MSADHNIDDNALSASKLFKRRGKTAPDDVDCSPGTGGLKAMMEYEQKRAFSRNVWLVDMTEA